MRPSIRHLALPVLAAFSMAASAQDNNGFSSDVPAQDWATCTDITRHGLISLRAPVEASYSQTEGGNVFEESAPEASTGKVQINCYRRASSDDLTFLALHRAATDVWSHIAAQPDPLKIKAYSLTDKAIFGDSFTIRTSKGVQDPATGCVTRLFDGAQEKQGVMFIGAYTHCPSVQAASEWEKSLKERGDRVESTVTEKRAKGTRTYKLVHRQ
jgi:hypothetical protein